MDSTNIFAKLKFPYTVSQKFCLNLCKNIDETLINYVKPGDYQCVKTCSSDQGTNSNPSFCVPAN